MPHDVEDGFAPGDQMVGNDAPMASPPYGFRTHDRAASFAPLTQQVLEARAELFRKRIVGIVVEAVVRPEAVDVPRQGSRLSAKAAEWRHVFIANTEAHQGSGERILVELRIGPRPRNRSDIRDERYIGSPQQLDELLEASVRMADGAEWELHASPLFRCALEGTAFVGCNVIGLVALDLVLGIAFRRAMDMTLVIEILGVNGDDRSRYPTGFGIPAYVIADFELSHHPNRTARALI